MALIQQDAASAGMKWVRFWIGCLVFFSATTGVAFAEQTLVAYKVDKGHVPVIDGNRKDQCWAKSQPVVTHDNVADIDLTLQAAYTDAEIYLLVRFPDPDESRLHKPWVWNAQQNAYEMGPQREDCFVLKWAFSENMTSLSIYGDSPHKADIWFWKSHRTDRSGFADDKHQIFERIENEKAKKLVQPSGKVMFLQRKGDSGTAAYKTIFQFVFAGDLVPQFSADTPSGSRADIRAKGVWHEGEWCIEFSRRLNTGNADDVQFKTDKTYLFGVSRYEIAGRKPDKTISQPLYGSGDVSEKLWLSFSL